MKPHFLRQFSAAFGQRSQLVAVGCGLVMATFLLANMPGCGPQELENTMPNPIVISDASGSSDLEQGLDFLNRLEQFDPQQIQPKVLKHLQQWLDKQRPAEDWQADDTASQLQPRFASMVTADQLSSRSFEDYDLFALQEATWLRDVTRAVARRDVWPGNLQQQVEQTSDSSELSIVTRLFDWTVRNLRTDRAVRRGDTHRMNSDVILHVWEAMLLGRGTVAEKSRVFILLARQMRIPVVMLAIERTVGEPPEPWVPAALVDGQLYLFEMRLGTPIPNPDGGIATWSDIVANPSWLKSLGTEQFPYPINTADLQRVAALVDATPAYLSQRMKTLEVALTGSDKMVLSVAPNQLAQAIAENGIQRIGIWDLAYEAFAIRSEMTVATDSPGFVTLLTEHSLLEHTPLKDARVLHFRGQFEATADEQPGALNLYLAARTSNQQIEQLRVNSPSEAALASESDPAVAQQRAEHAARLANLTYIMRRTNESASFWLGVMNFDWGKYQVSIDFLQKQLLRKQPDTIWRDAAYYNLGRAFEALAAESNDDKLRDQARESYQQVDDGPVADACRWRLLRLGREMDAQEADQGSDLAEEPAVVELPAETGAVD